MQNRVLLLSTQPSKTTKIYVWKNYFNLAKYI